MEVTQDNLFSIQFVSNMTGINPHTIRAWEKRYGATKPARDKNGRRLYSNSEVHRLRILQQLVNQGNNISDIAELSINDLESILTRYEISSDGVQQNVEKEDIDIAACFSNIQMALNFFKLDVFSYELDKASIALSDQVFVNKIVLPVIAEIRVLMTSNKLESSKRELLYLILKSALTKKMRNISNKTSVTKRVTVASATGQLNELGAMAAAVLFQGIGMSVDFLGGNVAPRAIGELNKHFNSDFIFLGLNYSHEAIMSTIEKEKYLDELAQNTDARTKVMIGAFDFCFKLPSDNMQCFSEFEELTHYVKKYGASH